MRITARELRQIIREELRDRDVPLPINIAKSEGRAATHAPPRRAAGAKGNSASRELRQILARCGLGGLYRRSLRRALRPSLRRSLRPSLITASLTHHHRRGGELGRDITRRERVSRHEREGRERERSRGAAKGPKASE